jgi:hypothetical protein
MAPPPPDSPQLKPEAIALEDIESHKEVMFPIVEYTQEELKKVVRKLDFHLMPLCFLLYTFSVLDVSSNPTFPSPRHPH